MNEDWVEGISIVIMAVIVAYITGTAAVVTLQIGQLETAPDTAVMIAGTLFTAALFFLAVAYAHVSSGTVNRLMSTLTDGRIEPLNERREQA